MDVNGHKIFISYKFHDYDVQQMINHHLFEQRKFGEYTPRDYLNVLEKYIKEYSPHYYKAEEDDRPMDGKTEDEIWESLKDKMFDSTMTIVLISPHMKDLDKEEKDQWIPREIRYSLGFETRFTKSGKPIKSNMNAMMAIVLPDRNVSYSYYFEKCDKCDVHCRINKTNTFLYTKKKYV